MPFQTVFCRYETKHFITAAQKETILQAMQSYMQPDQYGKTIIRNLYFDTPAYLLIRRSMDKPVYKEKLRVRSYARATGDSTVFVELKKKYDQVVYKRRVCIPEADAMDWLMGTRPCSQSTQITKEVDHVLGYYGTLRPKVFLSYQREAYYAADGSGFRVTFDDQLLCRQEDLSLRSQVYGTSLLADDQVLMELKCAGGIPLWMTRVLSQEQIYKTSFSKYGAAYKTIIFPQLQGIPAPKT